jgi:hypothetical protein
MTPVLVRVYDNRYDGPFEVECGAAHTDPVRAARFVHLALLQARKIECETVPRVTASVDGGRSWSEIEGIWARFVEA